MLAAVFDLVGFIFYVLFYMLFYIVFGWLFSPDSQLARELRG